MKALFFALTMVLASPAFATITLSKSPSLSPSIGEYEDGAKLVDENSHAFPSVAVIFPDSSGHSNIASVDIFDAGVSQVSGRQMPPQYKLASGKKIPMVSLMSLDTSAKTVIPFTLPSTSLGKIAAVTCNAGAGGGATAVLTCTGLVTTDTVLAVSQKTPGANSLPLLGWSTLASNAITAIWSADPGAGAVVMVLVKHL